MPNHVFHRNPKAQLPVAVAGDGCYIIDAQGKRYFDGSCGAAVSCLGHSNEQVRQAMKDQLDKLAFAHTGFFTNEPMEELADFLIERAPDGLDRVYFFSGGSEAVEAAIKLSRQYFLEQGKTEKSVIIARKQSYHGNTLGALSAGGNQWRREQFKPLLVKMHHISPCYEYRLKLDGESSFDFGQRVANELEAKILEIGQEKVAAFLCEPVVGATMGCVAAVDGYLKRIREICTQYDVLMVLDEVMCGMGRTGSLFACEEDGVAPDLLTVAKGLGAGYQPIGAMLVSQEIYDTIVGGSGFFQHGHTYIGHALACTAALEVQKIIESENLLDNVKDKGDKLRNAFVDAFGEHQYIGDIRGRGLFIGVEFVEDKATKKTFSPDRRIHAKLKAAAMDAGLMCYPMGGTIDGVNGAHVMFAPPFIMEDKHVGEIVDKFSQAMDCVF